MCMALYRYKCEGLWNSGVLSEQLQAEVEGYRAVEFWGRCEQL